MKKSWLILKKDRSGFTLIELMIVIAIIAILAGAAIPGFSVLLPNYRLKSAAQDLYSNFQLAKMTAIKKNKYCIIAHKQPIGGTTYSYAIYVDENKDKKYQAGEDVLTKIQWSDYKDVSLNEGDGGFNFPNNDDILPALIFRANGLPIAVGDVHLKNIKGRKMKVDVTIAGNISISVE